MKLAFSGVSRRAILFGLAAIPALSVTLPSISALAQMPASGDPLPSWNDGPAKKTIVELVKVTTDRASPKFVPPEARIATFGQDGTTWVEHPGFTKQYSERLLRDGHYVPPRREFVAWGALAKAGSTGGAGRGRVGRA
jgi:hypothetical protein